MKNDPVSQRKSPISAKIAAVAAVASGAAVQMPTFYRYSIGIPAPARKKRNQAKRRRIQRRQRSNGWR